MVVHGSSKIVGGEYKNQVAQYTAAAKSINQKIKILITRHVSFNATIV